MRRLVTDSITFTFNGNGYVLFGNLIKNKTISPAYLNRVLNKFGSEIFALAEPADTYVAELEVFIDGKFDQKVKMPMKNTGRRLEPAWKYLLDEGCHVVTLKWINNNPDYEIRINDMVVYSEKSGNDNIPK